jgi:fluoride ion exporter CrcB/FEX
MILQTAVGPISGFTFGTVAVNIIGCFIMGVAIDWFALKTEPINGGGK